MKKASLVSSCVVAASALGFGIVAACGTSSTQGTGTGNNPDGSMPSQDGSFVLTQGDSSGSGSGGDGAGCTGLQCSIHSCSGGGSTTISGTVYDPAGNNPLYNVVVYVPNTTPSPLTTGASCDSCASLYTGNPIAAAVTDAKGQFTIKNAPDGTDIPLVIQIGKWRKQTTVPSVASCTDNAVAAKLTLPSKQSEGDIPSIAVSTGGADSLECLLQRIGLDPSEYGGGAGGTGRIHIFQGSSAPDVTSATASTGTTPLSSAALWGSLATLMPYDITILSCEGQETEDLPAGTPLTTADQSNLLQYASAGGRVFTSHFHYAWFNTGPFAAQNLALWTPNANPINDSANNPITSNNQGDFINANIITTFADGGPFPKGVVLDQWLANVGALGTGGVAGELHINGAKHNADLNGLASTPSQGWIAADQNAQGEVIELDGSAPSGTAYDAGGTTQYLSFNTPFDAGVDDAGDPNYCGRIVYSDLHVGAASFDYRSPTTGLPVQTPLVPTGCANNPLSPQEKALEFMLFDLSSCVTPDTGSGQPPIPLPIK